MPSNEKSQNAGFIEYLKFLQPEYSTKFRGLRKLIAHARNFVYRFTYTFSAIGLAFMMQSPPLKKGQGGFEFVAICNWPTTPAVRTIYP